MSEQISPSSGVDDQDAEAGEKQRTRSLHGIAKWVFVLFTAAAVLLSINQLFNLQFFAGVVILEGRYLFLLAGLFLSLTFLSFPLKGEPGASVAWYDWFLAALGAGVAGYFAYTADLSLEEGWEYAPPETARWISILFWLLILEATRRAGGLVIFLIVFVFSLYPTFADVLPGPISGFAQPFLDVIPYHIISSESSFGIPMRAFGNLVIGFIIFGAALQYTGGGAFFNNLALALVGGLRGGAAKVAIFASGFMGSLSGSVISNVLTTGAISIPAMKKTGFPARYAAGTEACASTGGVLMPPVMGTTAFVMASFLGRPYLEIAAAAAVPSILYYFGLFVQIDAYAARHNLKGIPREQLPSIWETMKEGWYYLFVFALLIFLMMFLRQETWAPFFATALLLVINQASKKHRFDIKGFFNLIYSIGRGLTELVAVLLGIGLIVGAFSATGLAGTLVNDLIFLAGGSVFMLLIMGAITSFIFGMGMTVTACYIFLAVVLAPALVKAGLNELAVHLFILYWGMVSYITPPVALGAFAAATMARTNALSAGVEAMRLGSIIYFVPFFFVLNPALIGEGSWVEVAVVFATAVFGVYLIGSALQGYVAGFGRIGTGPVALGAKILLLLGGLFFAAPGDVIPGVSHLQMGLIGALLGAPVLIYARMNRRRESAVG
ncbi:TRAP transporter fused permease subunit [Nisaea acidiphila]|uniref:TRAP transporter fused permease subunit n=1 Tax=Nisaea acidiphila TaxID=1862145 RepID=A0A9J7AW17_9PROT|nr:TRAP transporter fused permease subunit [Nisaea acidiphila]UUX50641.1 TRAP transporter fused permease subunit [Nisaea acidiphila]